MIMDLKERVARPSSSFSPSSFLLKSDLHFAAKVRKRFCFRRQKATEREREKERWRMRSFVHSLCFVLSFPGRRRWLVPFRATTKLYEKSTGISTTYAKFMARSRAPSSPLMYIQKLYHQWKNRETVKIYEIRRTLYCAREWTMIDQKENVTNHILLQR